jgi:hypothetical protein
MTSTGRESSLELDYAQTTELLRGLTDARFKLLAFVPTVCGAAVAFLSRAPNAAELLAVGAIGLVATLGVVIYELRNTQVYDYALYRAQALEAQLQQVSIFDPARPGGLFSERPGRDLRLFGLAVAGHDRGLALVYSAAIGGWSYLVAWGALHALGVGEPQKLGGAVGVLAGVAVLVEFLRVGSEPPRN